ncbi:MAG: hypothetical protein LC745_04710, partial [Planctomycetia bacterium]|nr:hypothetical protein [Planctomycetia bacterium]
CTPWVVAASLVSFGDVGGVPSSGELGVLSDRPLSALWAGQGTEMLATCLLSTVGYAAAGWVLYRSSCRGFDAALDRPPLTAAGVSPPGRPTRPRRNEARGRRRASLSKEVPRP